MVLNYLPSNPRFVHLNEVIGALEMTKAEILRRVIAPYEAEKCILNGDVYDLTNKS